MKKLFLSFVILNTLYLLLYTYPAFAQQTCTPIFGGGQTCTATPRLILKIPTPTPTPLLVFPNSMPQTTKGGLPILPSSQTTTNPATGPEALVLIPLLSSGVIGYLLRRKVFPPFCQKK